MHVLDKVRALVGILSDSFLSDSLLFFLFALLGGFFALFFFSRSKFSQRGV
jgi:hypothetical protein